MTLWRWLFRRQAQAGLVHETYEVPMPWIVYGYFVPEWVIRTTGRTCVRCDCSICGEVAYATLRIPRWGPAPTPESGRHPVRERFMEAHEHPGVSRNPLSWERPLRNMAALQEGDLEDVFGLVVDRAHREAP